MVVKTLTLEEALLLLMLLMIFLMFLRMQQLMKLLVCFVEWIFEEQKQIVQWSQQIQLQHLVLKELLCQRE